MNQKLTMNLSEEDDWDNRFGSGMIKRSRLPSPCSGRGIRNDHSYWQ